MTVLNLLRNCWTSFPKSGTLVHPQAVCWLLICPPSHQHFSLSVFWLQPSSWVWSGVFAVWIHVPWWRPALGVCLTLCLCLFPSSAPLRRCTWQCLAHATFSGCFLPEDGPSSVSLSLQLGYKRTGFLRHVIDLITPLPSLQRWER